MILTLDDVHGDGVNIADRLQGLADPGGIVISGSAYDHVADKINIGLQSLGEQSVKKIDKPIRAYRVHLDGSATKPRVGIGPLRRRVVSLAAIAVILIAIPLVWWNWSGGHQTAIADAGGSIAGRSCGDGQRDSRTLSGRRLGARVVAAISIAGRAEDLSAVIS